MPKEKIICGTPVDVIRKSYFKGKIGKLLTDIQAEKEYTKTDIGELQCYLEFLKNSDDKISNQFASFIPKLDDIDGTNDFVLDELNKESLSEAELTELEKEKVAREFAVRTASKLLRDLFVRYYDPKKPTPTNDELMDMSFEMLGLQYYLIRDALYKERLFRKQITEFERSGKQRKLAEEYAKAGLAYRDYALAEGLKDLATELINLSKKRFSQF